MISIEQIIARLERDRFAVDEGTSAIRAYRRGWNANAEHTARWLRVELGLHELAASDVDRGGL